MKKEATRKANKSKGSTVSRLKDGVRGKYYRQALAGTNLVLIEGACPLWAKPAPTTAC